MIPICAPVEMRNPDGSLRAVGVEWNEPRRFIEGVVGMAGGLIVVVGAITELIGLFAVWIKDGKAWGLVGGGVVLMWIGYSIMKEAHAFDGIRRAFWFGRIGEMVAPFGMAYYGTKETNLTVSWADIVNIESERIPVPHGEQPSDWPCGVRLIMRDGHIIRVGWHLSEDHAHMLAVKLSTQLGRMKGVTAIDGGTGGTVEVVIG